MEKIKSEAEFLFTMRVMAFGFMLQSLLPRPPPLTSNPNSSMKTKRSQREHHHDEDEEEDDSNLHEPSFKRQNLSSEKTVVEVETHQDEQQQQEEQQEEEGESTGLKLLGLLLQCAECVAMDNLDFANDLLPEVIELSSPFGTSPERVGAYFAQALQARVVSSCLGSYSPLTAKSVTLTQSQRIFNAFQSYNSVSPLVKFSHFTANQAIFQAH